MKNIIDAAIHRSRMVLALMLVGVILGGYVYAELPRESDPEVPIPFVLVQAPLMGASPEDVERLLVRPLETELQGLEGLVEMSAVAAEGMATVTLEFPVSFDPAMTVIEVREKVDNAKRFFPSEAEEPIVEEFNSQSLFPVLTVALAGDLPERSLYRIAKDLQDRIEAIDTVLEAQLSGAREEVLEIVIDPLKLQAYNLTADEVLNAVSRNNRLVAAGDVSAASGRFSIKVPGLIETYQDVVSLPLRATDGRTLTMGDVADVRRTFLDRERYSELNGRPTMSLGITKRSGANIIEMTEAVRAEIAAAQRDWPSAVSVSIIGDQSIWIDSSQKTLQSSITTAILLVMIVVVAALGVRPGLLVGLSIPSTFMLSFVLMGVFGLTVNFMSMFALVLAVGILVDAGIVVVEYANRKLDEGANPLEAYSLASKRMFWPIIASTATTLAAFVPFLFWDDIPGKYMAHLPKTLIFVLCSSLITALIIVPVIGAVVGTWREKRQGVKAVALSEKSKALAAEGGGDPRTLPGFTGWYARFVDSTINRPLITLGGALAAIAIAFGVFYVTPIRTEYFLDSEPEQLNVYVSARGNLSAEESFAYVREVYDRIADVEGVEDFLARTYGPGGATFFGGPPADAVGVVSVILPEERFAIRNGREIEAEIRERLAQVAGVRVAVEALEQGPPEEKPVELGLYGSSQDDIDKAAGAVAAYLAALPGVIEIEDTLSRPGFELRFVPDRENAGRYGADVATIGAAIQMVTNGVLVGEYRPDDSDEEVDIRARFPESARDLSALSSLRVTTMQGPVPLATLVREEVAPRVASINRRDGERYGEVKASIADGARWPDGTPVDGPSVIASIENWIATEAKLPPSVTIKFGGEFEETQSANAFFIGAMLAGLFMIGVILLWQFNNFYHMFLTLFSVVLSTVGVLFGLAISSWLSKAGIQFGMPYLSIIMTGTGVVALAGIVVNINIVLIDTYQRLLRTGFTPPEAAMRTASQRLRPIVLTTGTTICGLMPMMVMLTFDYASGRVNYGGRVAEFWVPLSSAVVWGLFFSTLLTLLMTPALLALPHRISKAVERRRAERALAAEAGAREREASDAAPAEASGLPKAAE